MKMRELLFRGQQRKKGEKVRLDGSPVESSWFYGSGVLQSQGDFSIIYQTEPVFSKHSVYSDTLGQYTGLTDKHGTKIFEGDIVNILTQNEEIGVVEYDDGGFEVKAAGFTVDFHSNICGTDLEVIGNIYDNPELLESIKGR